MHRHIAAHIWVLSHVHERVAVHMQAKHRHSFTQTHTDRLMRTVWRACVREHAHICVTGKKFNCRTQLHILNDTDTDTYRTAKNGPNEN